MNASPQARRVSFVTLALLVVVLVTALAQSIWPGWLPALRRDPVGFAEGEWWRLPTALFAYDDGEVQIVSIVAGLVILGAIGEPVFGSLRWFAMWSIVGLVGSCLRAVGGSRSGPGSSVAVAGLLGTVAAWTLRPQTAVPLFARAGQKVVFVGAAVLRLLRDIHGPPVFVGAALAMTFLLRPRTRSAGWDTAMVPHSSRGSGFRPRRPRNDRKRAPALAAGKRHPAPRACGAALQAG